MRFFAVKSRAALARSVDTAYLVSSDWDDYGYKTTFNLYYYDYRGGFHEIGDLKVGVFGLTKEQGRAALPGLFESLPGSHFSLGQDDSYYEKLNGLQEITRNTILGSLNDVAFDPNLFAQALTEPVTGRSLLRFVSMATVQNQFSRMAHGGVRLSAYSFTYTYPVTTGAEERKPAALSFSVDPTIQPPTNVHVIIGKNGVGKSRLLNHITDILVKSAPDEASGSMDFGTEGKRASTQFANLISVAFSAFDEFTPHSSPIDKTKGLPYTYIGLKKVPRNVSDTERPSAPKSTIALAREFSLSVKSCVEGARLDRWRRALEMLQSDPIFADAQVADLADAEWSDDRLQGIAREIFRSLSSGHKIVLLTVTRLVETIEDRSLVLLDEPESHLHPPLLSAFIRALSDLLMYRNGVAIIATHSPVVLQEVPKNCVWKLQRFGGQVAVDRPQLETFGENVGTLTQEIFGLEVTNSGFHKLLSDAVAGSATYEAVLQKFDNNLGNEAKAMVRALLATRSAGRPF